MLCASLVALDGCAGTYRLDETQSTINQPAAADIIRLRWHRKLVLHDVFDFRPQEWSSGVFDERGTLFIGTSARRFQAFRPNGRLLWSTRTEGAISSKPLYDKETGLVFFGADDGRLYAVDAKSGKVSWRWLTGGTISRMPTVHEGMLMLTSSENRIYGLDAATGRWRWQYDREQLEGFTIQGIAGPTVDNGIVYTGFSDGVVVALKPTSGEVIWTRNLSGGNSRFVDVDATPVRVGKAIVTASYASGVYALSPETGSVLWHFPIEGASTVVGGRGRIYLTAPQAGLIALDLLGRELWRQAMPKGVPSQPVLAGRYLLLTGTESGLFVVSERTGELLQHFDPGHGISAPPTVGHDMVVVLSNLGQLFSFSIN